MSIILGTLTKRKKREEDPEYKREEETFQRAPRMSLVHFIKLTDHAIARLKIPHLSYS